ncbi:hypothetical protein D3C75_1284150 [compost metagenome]
MTGVVLYLHDTDNNNSYSGQIKDGKFTVLLPDGNYQLDRVNDMNNFKDYTLNLKFKASAGVVDPGGSLTITIP